MLNPLPPDTADVCSVCQTFTDGYDTCYPCGWNARFADAVLAVSYSIHFGQLHTALQQYKRTGGTIARRFQLELAAVLWRFLSQHEQCLARQAGVDGFGLVTTVPSSVPERDASHPLRRIVGSLVGPTRDRFASLLVRSGTPVAAREGPRQVQPHSGPRRRVDSAHRRHLDYGRERPERRGWAQDSRSRRGRSAGHRPPHPRGLRGQRGSPARPATAIRVERLRDAWPFSFMKELRGNEVRSRPNRVPNSAQLTLAESNRAQRSPLQIATDNR